MRKVKKKETVWKSEGRLKLRREGKWRKGDERDGEKVLEKENRGAAKNYRKKAVLARERREGPKDEVKKC